MTGWQFAGAVALLAGGTYAIRLAGVTLRTRTTVSPLVEALLERSTMVLLIAVGLTGTLFEGTDLAGPARPVGVAIGVVAAWFKAPLVVVIVAAAASTALLRLAGVP
ncbi:AzlD domain-containing protein [Gordonia humi]|uniref:Branched-subunit amino acid transport protein n=1 Tax=Gordonia humi TaxID=686429 RepID=A0A840EPT7_9ACTN|nr:AzlD domain-containing protein [Gordonia humi]MBB4133501.1 branched-subunit amino acid transport protein [Gordonia humi]